MWATVAGICQNYTQVYKVGAALRHEIPRFYSLCTPTPARSHSLEPPYRWMVPPMIFGFSISPLLRINASRVILVCLRVLKCRVWADGRSDSEPGL